MFGILNSVRDLIFQLPVRSEEHTSELQSPYDLVCRLLLEKKKKTQQQRITSIIFNRHSNSLTRYIVFLYYFSKIFLSLIPILVLEFVFFILGILRSLCFYF